MRWFKQLIVSVSLIAAMLGVTVGVANAEPAALASTRTHAKLALSFTPNRIEQGSSVHARYSAAGLPVGASLVLQYEVGTAQVWRTVRKLKARSGLAYAPPVPQGRYIYRLLALVGRKFYAQSPWRYLFSYGPVSFLYLCQNYSTAWCQPGTTTVGTTVFNYALDVYPSTYPDYAPIITMPNTSCRSITVSMSEDSGNPTGTVYDSVLQASALPQYGQSDSNGDLTTDTFTLNGSAWSLEVAVANGGDMFVNGTADCYSYNGL